MRTKYLWTLNSRTAINSASEIYSSITWEAISLQLFSLCFVVRNVAIEQSETSVTHFGLLWTVLHNVTYWELCIVSRWPSLANWVGFTLPQLAQIDLSCEDVPLNTKQTNSLDVYNNYIQCFNWCFVVVYRCYRYSTNTNTLTILWRSFRIVWSSDVLLNWDDLRC